MCMIGIQRQGFRPPQTGAGAAALLSLMLLSAQAEPVPSGTAGHCKPISAGVTECAVSGGSITHARCCERYPHGHGCADERPGQTQCSDEWTVRQQRTAQGLYWTQRFVAGAPAPRLCAPAGTVVAAGEELHCCSRAATPTGETTAERQIKVRCE